MNEPLHGRTIAVPETRALDVLARALESRGARVRACPLIGIRDPEDFSAVDHWLGAVCEEWLDDLVLLTGEGLRRLVARADAIRLGASFRDALAACRTITRGPKPAAALRELGLKPALAAPQPTSDSVAELLGTLSLGGRRVGVQYYGEQPVPVLERVLGASGAEVLPVYPYRYADQADDAQVQALIRAMAAGEIDAVTFTSSPQVRRLFEVAAKSGLETTLREGLARVCVVAVGPMVAEALRARGARVDVMPVGSYFIKPMIRALEAHWA